MMQQQPPAIYPTAGIDLTPMFIVQFYDAVNGVHVGWFGFLQLAPNGYPLATTEMYGSDISMAQFDELVDKMEDLCETTPLQQAEGIGFTLGPLRLYSKELWRQGKSTYGWMFDFGDAAFPMSHDSLIGWVMSARDAKRDYLARYGSQP